MNLKKDLFLNCVTILFIKTTEISLRQKILEKPLQIKQNISSNSNRSINFSTKKTKRLKMVWCDTTKKMAYVLRAVLTVGNSKSILWLFIILVEGSLMLISKLLIHPNNCTNIINCLSLLQTGVWTENVSFFIVSKRILGFLVQQPSKDWRHTEEKKSSVLTPNTGWPFFSIFSSSLIILYCQFICHWRRL